VYLADPVCDDVNVSLPLELYVVTFHSEYYGTSQGPFPLPVPSFIPSSPPSPPGRKKLKQVEAEIQRLTSIRHPNHTSVFAVKLTGAGPTYPVPMTLSSSPSRNLVDMNTNGHGHGRGPPQLMVLSEQAPALSLHDVLEDCDSLREDRAKVCVYLLFLFHCPS